MEEIKTKKKLNKKPLIICLVLALVFGIVGFVDIKSNAAESLYTARIYCKASTTFQGTTTEEIQIDRTVTSNSPIYAYVHIYTEPTTGEYSYRAHVISRSPISGGSSNANRTFTDSDGLTWYYSRGFSAGGNTSATINYSTWYAEGVESFCIINGSILDYEEFSSAFKNGTLDYTQVIDYDNFLIDDDMLIPENVKYNCIVNEYTSSPEEYIYDIYDVVSWDNTSEKYRIQIDSVPVVQYHKGSIKITSDIVNLGKKNTLIKEFLGEWKTEKIFDVVGNTFEKYQNGNNADMCDEIAFDFKKECDDKYTYNRFTESSILLFGYRIRYIDIENQKVSAWVYLMPMEKEWNYKSYSMYSNGTTSNEEDANGLVNEYTNMEDIYDGVNDIVTENIYKDKYGVTNGNIDTSQATNWLYSVVDFIKTTPSMLGTVLAFLPQPILYGMNVTIFLGCIASAIAIVKALI